MMKMRMKVLRRRKHLLRSPVPRKRNSKTQMKRRKRKKKSRKRKRRKKMKKTKMTTRRSQRARKSLHPPKMKLSQRRSKKSLMTCSKDLMALRRN